jgi:hypothetical protein
MEFLQIYDVECEKKVFKASNLYEQFSAWSYTNGYTSDKIPTSTKFGMDIRFYKGIEKKRTKIATEYIINIKELLEYFKDKGY